MILLYGSVYRENRQSSSIVGTPHRRTLSGRSAAGPTMPCTASTSNALFRSPHTKKQPPPCPVRSERNTTHLQALVMDYPASMSSYVSRLHPFPEEATVSSPRLRAISGALMAAKRSEAAGAAVTAGRHPSVTIAIGAANDGGPAAASITTDARATEVWQAAERLAEGTMGEGSSPSRAAGSLLASLSNLRGALLRYTMGGGGGVSGGAWEAMSAGPKGAALARAAVGAVVRVCRSEQPSAVHLEAARLAGEVSGGCINRAGHQGRGVRGI